MSTEDFSFSLSMPARPRAAASRYIARPFQARTAGQETLILAADSETAVRAPVFYTQMLAHCDRLRTIADHAASVMRQFDLPPEQQPAVQQGLSGLVERGLLQDEAGVYAALDPDPASPKSELRPLRTLCVRTCERPDDLARLLASLARHLDNTTLARVLVLDDARSRAAVAATARVLSAAAIGARVDLVHIDRARRARLVRRISAEAAVDPAALRWLVEGDDDDPAASYGAGLNLALLLSAGERFVMVDDDALLDPFVLAPPRKGLSLRVAHDFETRFPDPQEPEPAQFQALDIDPIGAHADLLGRPVGQLASGYGLQGGHLLEHLSPQMIHDFSARPRVRLTTNGTLGDSGTGGMLWLYSLPASALAPWLAAPESYRRLAFSRRAARSTTETQIASSVALMTTTLTGVDNRELLLPVPAKGRGEDLVFGAAIRYLYPGTPCAALPWMLPHRQQSSRQWSEQDLARRQGTGLAAYVAERIEDLAETVSVSDSAARVELLAEWMTALGRMSEGERLADLRRHLLERRTRTAAAVGETLAELKPPAWLARDFEDIVAGHLRIDADDTRRMALQAPAIERFATRYGQTLRPWVSAWRYLADNGGDRLLDETA
ncbi:MAG: hypothetical protein ACOCVP_03540 [Wenzhouxiangella sp.]